MAKWRAAAHRAALVALVSCASFHISTCGSSTGRVLLCRTGEGLLLVYSQNALPSGVGRLKPMWLPQPFKRLTAGVAWGSFCAGGDCTQKVNQRGGKSC